MRRLTTLCGLIFLLLHGTLASAGNTKAAADSIRRADREFARALAAHDEARFSSFLAEDVVSFAPEPAVGREAFLNNWAPLLKPGGPTLTWKPLKAEVYPSGDLGYTTGTYEQAGVGADGKPRRGVGNYLTVWRKQPDGSWKIAVDIGTAPVPARP